MRAAVGNLRFTTPNEIFENKGRPALLRCTREKQSDNQLIIAIFDQKPCFKTLCVKTKGTQNERPTVCLKIRLRPMPGAPAIKAARLISRPSAADRRRLGQVRQSVASGPTRARSADRARPGARRYRAKGSRLPVQRFRARCVVRDDRSRLRTRCLCLASFVIRYSLFYWLLLPPLPWPTSFDQNAFRLGFSFHTRFTFLFSYQYV